MAGEDNSQDDKTEASTQKHTDQARGSGNVPVSREVTAFVGLGAVASVLAYQTPGHLTHAVLTLRMFISDSFDPELLGSASIRLAQAVILELTIPVLIAGIVAVTATVLLQTKFLIHLGALEPKWSRVSPSAGFRRIFGANGLTELVKSLVKLSLIILVVWLEIGGDVGLLLRLPWQDTHLLFPLTATLMLRILVAGLCTQGLIAAVDLGWVRFRHSRNLRMSKQDIRDEFKETEGNPHIKARIRRIRTARARKRMMAKVPSATVVITNPTHYAIALVYDRVVNPAPRIVAKGVDSVAAKIREIAQANNVPIVANPPLARALYRLELESEIPAEHYKAVAEIIAFVWRLRRTAASV